MTPGTETNALLLNSGGKPAPPASTLVLVVTLASGSAVGCGAKSEDASASNPTPTAQVAHGDGVSASDDTTPSDARLRREVAPPPELPPEKPELAHEVPDILAELEDDPAYKGIWEPDRRDDLDLLLTGMAALVAESPVTRHVVDGIKGRELEKAITRPFAIRSRTGALPSAFVDRFRRHLEVTKAEPHRGLWLPADSGKARDYAALAAYVDANEPEYFRELLASRRAGAGQWAMTDKPPKRPWLATETGVLERLAQLDDLTTAERGRLDFLAIPTLPEDAACSTVAKLFGPDSKKSSAQMEQLWPEYKGKRFSWKVRITDVSSAAIGSGYAVQAKCLDSSSLIQDVQLDYGDEARDFVLGLDRDSVHQLDGMLTAYSQTFGLVADGHP